MSESYNAPGSPYWALKGFLFLALPKDHEFWKIEAAPLPKLDEFRYLQHANMLIQRGEDHVVALVPGRTEADGHSHTIEKYSKFAYSSKFGFSIARSSVTLQENAPDSMLAFEVYGYFFVKNTIEKTYEIGETGIVCEWSPIEGIRVRTTIRPTEKGHLRIHEIESDRDCRAYDCGFALPTDDRRPFEREAKGNRAVVKNESGYCEVRGDGTGDILIPDPNTNLLYPKTSIPMVVYEIQKGKQTISTEVIYL